MSEKSNNNNNRGNGFNLLKRHDKNKSILFSKRQKSTEELVKIDRLLSVAIRTKKSLPSFVTKYFRKKKSEYEKFIDNVDKLFIFSRDPL